MHYTFNEEFNFNRDYMKRWFFYDTVSATASLYLIIIATIISEEVIYI